MKYYILITVLLLAVPLSAQKITVDESKALISFNFIDDDVEGIFEEFEFTGNINLSDLQNSTLSGTVVVKTIDTNNWLRSRHLRSRKYFNARDFPKIKFNSISILGVAEGFQVSGTLQIKGTEKTVIWNFTNDGNQLTGTTSVNTHDYDISIHDRKAQNKVTVKIVLPYH
jgi:polyisoprenoid-binding protein YceI